MTIQNKEIIVFEAEEFDEKEWPETNAIKFIEWFSEKVNIIPSEYRNTAEIEMDSACSYESSSYVTLKIWYVRPETPAEERHRIMTRENDNEIIERRERERLRFLKAKYEG